MGTSTDPVRWLGSIGWDSSGFIPREVQPVPVVPLKQIVDRAFSERYGVAAINVVNDLTLEAVLAAAVRAALPGHHPDVGQDGPGYRH